MRSSAGRGAKALKREEPISPGLKGFWILGMETGGVSMLALVLIGLSTIGHTRHSALPFVSTTSVKAPEKTRKPNLPRF